MHLNKKYFLMKRRKNTKQDQTIIQLDSNEHK